MNVTLNEFQAASKESWKERLVKDLKGISFEDLTKMDANGIAIAPFYTAEDIIQPITTAAQNDWDIVVNIDVKDAATANATALEQLEGGATGLRFLINEDIDIPTLLQNIDVKHIHTSFVVAATMNPEDFANNLKAYCSINACKWDHCNLAVEYDTIAYALEYQTAVELDPFVEFIDAADGIYTITVNGDVYQNAGANSVTQLALIAAHLNEYLQTLKDIDRLQHVTHIKINTAVSTAYFEEIAKLRALQTIVANVVAAYNIQPRVAINTITSGLYKSHLDSYSNMLRDTISTKAAVVGGSTSVVTLPFDCCHQEATPFSNRIARNIQLLLKEESYLDKVGDIAGGSYFIEQLTASIADKAWILFQELSIDSYLCSSIQEKVQTLVNQQAQELIAQYKQGEKVLIGVNKYPNTMEEPNIAPLIQTAATRRWMPAINIATAIL